MVASDFNYIISPHEKKGDRPFVDNTEFREYRDFIHSTNLVDLALSAWGSSGATTTKGVLGYEGELIEYLQLPVRSKDFLVI